MLLPLPLLLLLVGSRPSVAVAVDGMTAEAKADAIVNLPGLTTNGSTFGHFSGYLQVSPTHFLHYWFVQSQGNPQKDPLIVWFNGGPGCSSLMGLLKEMGPYVVSQDGKTLEQNKNAWTQLANIVYIEAPAGVGFSYATSEGNTITDDDLTSAENYEAIKQWFTRFPSFRHHDTYITGESYGGIYVPTLTERIIDGQGDFKINLKGMAIGNGLLDYDLDEDTTYRFMYGHGIIDDQRWTSLLLACCSNSTTEEQCDLSQSHGSQDCADEKLKADYSIQADGLNIYDIYRRCDTKSALNSPRFTLQLDAMVPPELRQRFAELTNNQVEEEIGSDRQSDSVPCVSDADISTYLNQPEVRKALHVSDNVSTWEICNEDIFYRFGRIHRDVTPQIKRIIGAGVRVLLYYGNTDMACNYLMGQKFCDRLGYKRSSISNQPWTFNGQTGGFKTVYEKGVTYLTVHGTGHMAPQPGWRAPQMQHVVKQFLANKNI